MRPLEIFNQWLNTVWGGAGIFIRILLLILSFVAYILLGVAIIFKWGLNVFKILFDETVIFALKGNSFLDNALDIFDDILNILFYYIRKMTVYLFPSLNLEGERPTLATGGVVALFLNVLVSLWFFFISIIIFIITIYWGVTLIQALLFILNLVLSLFNTKISDKSWLYDTPARILFNPIVYWGVRIVGLSILIFFRFGRLKKQDKNLKFFEAIKSYKSPFWAFQAKVSHVEKGKLYWVKIIAKGIIGIFLFFLLWMGLFRFSEKHQKPIQLATKDTLRSQQKSKDTLLGQENTKDTSIDQQKNKDEKIFIDEKVRAPIILAKEEVEDENYDWAIEDLSEAYNYSGLPKDFKIKVQYAIDALKLSNKKKALKLINEIVIKYFKPI